MTVKVKWVGRTTNVCYESDSYTPNIYEDFLPLAVLCKVSLVLPVRDVFRGMSNLNFKWYSFEVISILLISPCLAFVLPSQISYADNFNPSFDVEGLIYFLSNFWFIFGQQLLINLLEKIDQFDHSLNFESKVRYHKKVNKYIWVVMVCMYPIALLSKVSLELYSQQSCTQYKCALIEIFRGFFVYQHHLQMAIFMFFCYEIKMRFKTLNDVFHDFIKKTYQCDPVLVENYPQLEAHRLQYARLIQCTKTLNELFGWRLAFMFAAIIIYIILLLYFFYTVKGYILSGYDVIVVVFSFFLLFSLTHNTDLLVIESQQMEKFLFEISTQNLNWASLFQDIFGHRIKRASGPRLTHNASRFQEHVHNSPPSNAVIISENIFCKDQLPLSYSKKDHGTTHLHQKSTNPSRTVRVLPKIGWTSH